MATLIVRDVDEQTKAALRQRAALNGRSTEAEVRSILTESVRKKSWVASWLEQAETLRGKELPLPTRSLPRELELFEGWAP
jgi:plasmid stability protein